MLEDLTFKSLGLVNYHETMDLMRSHIKEKEVEKYGKEIRKSIWKNMGMISY